MKGLKIEVSFGALFDNSDTLSAKLDEVQRGLNIVTKALDLDQVQRHTAVYGGDTVVTFTAGEPSG